jgi:transcriptional regulator with XRE-family HTH domain
MKVKKESTQIENLNNQMAAFREKISALDYTYDVCAKAVGVSKSSFSRKIRGETEFTLSEFIKLCQFIDVPVSTGIDIFLS